MLVKSPISARPHAECNQQTGEPIGSITSAGVALVAGDPAQALGARAAALYAPRDGGKDRVVTANAPAP